MKTYYVVYSQEYDDTSIHAVAETEERAKLLAEWYNAEYSEVYDTETNEIIFFVCCRFSIDRNFAHWETDTSYMDYIGGFEEPFFDKNKFGEVFWNVKVAALNKERAIEKAKAMCVEWFKKNDMSLEALFIERMNN